MAKRDVRGGRGIDEADTPRLVLPHHHHPPPHGPYNNTTFGIWRPYPRRPNPCVLPCPYPTALSLVFCRLYTTVQGSSHALLWPRSWLSTRGTKEPLLLPTTQTKQTNERRGHPNVTHDSQLRLWFPWRVVIFWGFNANFPSPLFGAQCNRTPTRTDQSRQWMNSSAKGGGLRHHQPVRAPASRVHRCSPW